MAGSLYFNANMGVNKGTGIDVAKDLSQNTKYHMNYNTAGKTAEIAGVQYQFDSNAVNSSQPSFKLFASTSAALNGFIGKIYSAVIKQNGEEKLRLVPCKNASGIAGFYDLVSSTFLRSTKNGSDFIAGPPV